MMVRGTCRSGRIEDIETAHEEAPYEDIYRAWPTSGDAVEEGDGGDMTYTVEEGERILAEVRQHPKRDLIETIAETTFDLANEDGTGRGGGMWWHLECAHALVEALPELTLRAEPTADDLP